MEVSSMESSQMNVEAAFLNSKLIESDTTEQIIIIDPNGESRIIQETSSIQNSNMSTMNKQSNIWECEYIESAVSSSDESSPGKNNQEQEPKQCTSKQSDDIQDKQSKKIVRKNYGRVKIGNQVSNVEDSAVEVRKRFEMGCECAESCFRGLNPEAVYRHRLNIAELTKEEHDMYLMGVTMACMSDPVSTNKRRERRRARPNYAYSGRRVCLSAFLYLENVTLYQLKRIRKHVMTHGVTPRIHGNHGKKPHNVFPLDIYRRATYFLKDFIQQHNISGNPKGPIVLPPDVTRKSVHSTYKDYVCSLYSSNEKILGYSTFRHFMKEQFPNLRFSKTESGSVAGNSKGQNSKQQNKTQRTEENKETENVNQIKGELSSAEIDVSELPLLITQPLKNNEPQTIILPLSHFLKRKDLTPQTFTITTL